MSPFEVWNCMINIFGAADYVKDAVKFESFLPV